MNDRSDWVRKMIDESESDQSLDEFKKQLARMFETVKESDPDFKPFEEKYRLGSRYVEELPNFINKHFGDQKDINVQELWAFVAGAITSLAGFFHAYMIAQGHQEADMFTDSMFNPVIAQMIRFTTRERLDEIKKREKDNDKKRGLDGLNEK